VVFKTIIRLVFDTAKRHFLFPQKKSNQKKTLGLRSDPMRGSALAGPVVAGSALMPIGNGEQRVVLLPDFKALYNRGLLILVRNAMVINVVMKNNSYTLLKIRNIVPTFAVLKISPLNRG